MRQRPLPTTCPPIDAVAEPTLFASISTDVGTIALRAAGDGVTVHTVAILVVDGALPFDLAIPAQIFAERPDTPYRAVLCGLATRAVTDSGFGVDLAAGLGSCSASGHGRGARLRPA